jgi:hypothetical protein
MTRFEIAIEQYKAFESEVHSMTRVEMLLEGERIDKHTQFGRWSLSSKHSSLWPSVMYAVTPSCFNPSENNKENVAPPGCAAPVPSNRGLGQKKGLSLSSRPLADLSNNTSSATPLAPVVRIRARSILWLNLAREGLG